MIRILVGFFLFFVSAPAHAERRVALVVGNGAYATATRLPNPVNDARDVREKLERLGFEVVQALDATVDAFDAAVTTFERKATGADLALFFYAGHGLQFGGTNYLLPVDVKIDNDSALRRRAVVAQEVIEKMERAAKVNLVFLDACRNNTLLRDLERSLPEQTRNAASLRGLARMDPRGANTLIAFATAPNEVAADGAARNSPFTSALLRHIETPNISVQDMLTSVAGDVLSDTGQRQKPEVLSRLSRRVVLNEKAAPPIAAPPPLPPVAMSPSREREASVAWEVVKSSCDRDSLAAFRQRYGDTFFGDLAKQRDGQIAAGTVCSATTKSDVPRPPEVPTKPADPRDDKDLVQALQIELKRVGCYDGAVDGKWGDGSGTALKAYGQHTKSGPLQLSFQTVDALRMAKSRVCPLQCGPNEQQIEESCRAKSSAAPVALKQEPVSRSGNSTAKSDTMSRTEKFRYLATLPRCHKFEPKTIGGLCTKDGGIVCTIANVTNTHIETRDCKVY